MKDERAGSEEPLQATLTFVLVMGVCFAGAWFGLFALLKGRW